MIKKKILTMVLTAAMTISTVASIAPTTVQAAINTDVCGVVIDVGNSVVLPALHKLGLQQKANGGHDSENVTFIPSRFEQGKFYIAGFNFFDPNGSNDAFIVKVYPKNDPSNPVIHHLKSKQMISFDTGFDTPEYIIEFYNPGETTPFDNYYLSKDFKDKNYGISLAQNKNIYYLKKATGSRRNYAFIEEHSPKFVAHLDRDAEATQDIVDRFGADKAYRQSDRISKGDMSPAEYVEMDSVTNLLKQWQENTVKNNNSLIDSIRKSEDYTGNNISTITTKTMFANSDVTYSKDNSYSIDNTTFGIKQGGYLKYKVPVMKDGIYKINAEMEGTANLKYSYKERATGHFFDLNLTNSFSKDKPVYAWLKSGVNYVTLTNNEETDVKFKSISVDYLSGSKDYNTSNNNLIKVTDLSTFNGSADEGSLKPEFKNGYLKFYQNSAAEITINAPAKGKYLVKPTISSISGFNYEVSITNLTNNSTIDEPMYPLGDSMLFSEEYAPISAGTRTIELEEGQNIIKFANAENILDMQSVEFLKMSN